MSQRLFRMLGVMIAITLVPAAARAATINTYSFTQGDWHVVNQPPTFAKAGLLQGTFTATVGTSGQIGLNDITGFSLRYTDVVFAVPFQISWPITGLRFFSYRADLYDTDPNHGATTLSLIADDAVGPFPFPGCVGAAAVLSPVCRADSIPANALAVFGLWFSTSAPVITLVSSVEVQDPAVIPEPGTLMLLGTGLCGVMRVSRWRLARKVPVED